MISRAAGLLGCGWILLVGVACGGGPSDTTGTGGAGGAGAAGGAGGAGAAGGAGGAGGAGAAGGAGGAGGGIELCEPGEMRPCYEGPEGTEDVGSCKAGTQSCKANGEGFGTCTGQVVPANETCATPADDDCDGQANEEGPDCACVPGEETACYTGPDGTAGVGQCTAGVQLCNAEGTGFGPCEGQVTPGEETCATLADDDCDGLANEEGEGCACFPGMTQDCYSGPPATIGVGACKSGKATCQPDGLGYGPCEGEVIPQVEMCATPLDDDCNGLVNEEGPDCNCGAGAMKSCYPGPAGTEGVGACKAGTSVCQPDGSGYGPCTGAVLPVTETCNTPVDDDCDGFTNEDGPGCGCVPGTIMSCYAGPPETLFVGTCTSGFVTCQPDGLAYGPCEGQILPAPEVCSTQVDEDCNTAPDCGEASWAVGFGSPGTQQAISVAADSMGNTFIVGSFAGTLPVGGAQLVSAGGTDAFVIKLDPAGAPLWQKAFGSAGAFQQAASVAVDSAGNIVVTGYFDGTIDFGGGALTSAGNIDLFVAKLDPSGGHLWSKRFGSAGPQYGVDVAIDAQGNALVLAEGFGSVDFGGGALTSAGGSDMFVAKLDPAGAHLWSKRFGGAADDDAVALDADDAGNVVFGGGFTGSVDFGGGALASQGALDAFAVKLSAAGAHVWSKRFGNAANQGVTALAVEPSGAVLLGGSFEGSIDLGTGALAALGALDAFVARLDAAGNGMFAKRFGAPGTDIEVYAIEPGAGGLVLFGGPVTGPIDFGGGVSPAGGSADAYAVAFDAAGAHVWSKRHGGAANQYLRALAALPVGGAVAGGYFEGSMNMGASTLVSAGGLDVWAARLAP